MPSLSFYWFNMATREFKITHVDHILFLEDGSAAQAVLRSLPLLPSS